MPTYNVSSSLCRDLEALDSEIRDLEDQRDLATQRAETAESALGIAEERIEELESQLTEAEERVSDLEGQVADLEQVRCSA